MKHIPFPQANNLDLIFDIIMDIGNTGLTKSDVAAKYHMEERQGSYYLDALLYLGFVEKIHSKYFLTKKGITIKELPAHMRKKGFC